MVKFKTYKPLKLVENSKYWMYPLCMGCSKKLEGKGIEIVGAPMHINIICIVRSLYWHWKMKTRNYK